MVKIWLKYIHHLLEETKAVSLACAARYVKFGTFFNLSLIGYPLAVEIAIRGHHPSAEELVDL